MHHNIPQTYQLHQAMSILGRCSTSAFRISKDSCCLGPQSNLLFLRVSRVRGAAILEKFSINCL
ncbi:hypothetical protein HanRHA438_Chr14g0635231 [Helianthus annuus]|nr:hypothetical protein HanPI659440_Chr14g0528631 [Helianthus annuus]KAJ0852184.1 hypothetical protein HanRHA438_Chr14g0635231 [Helianthus annuus]